MTEVIDLEAGQLFRLDVVPGSRYLHPHLEKDV